jgi:uncharacterized protein
VEFDALFDAHFLGRTATILMPAEHADDEIRVREGDRGNGVEPPVAEELRESGQAAATAELLAARRFGPEPDEDVLRRFERALPERLPRRRGYRRRADRRGRALDLRRSLRDPSATMAR